MIYQIAFDTPHLRRTRVVKRFYVVVLLLIIGTTAVGCSGDSIVEPQRDGLKTATHESCFSTSISGPSFLSEKKRYYWSAQTECGNPGSITHEWYRVQDGVTYGPYSGSTVSYVPYADEYHFYWELYSTTVGCPPSHAGLCAGDPLTRADTLQVDVCIGTGCFPALQGTY